MDETDEYSKMCRMAKEIQEMRDRKPNGEIIKDKNDFTMAFFPSENKRINHMEIDDYWLPRQDQLQELVDFRGTVLIGHIPDGNLMLETVYSGIEKIYKAKTHEQLLLKCAMYELYNKKWDGNDWVEDWIKKGA